MNSNTIKKLHNPFVISSEQIDLLRRTICKGATEDEAIRFTNGRLPLAQAQGMSWEALALFGEQEP